MDSKLVERAREIAAGLEPQMQRFLADLIAIRSYTGQESQAVKRAMAELRAIGCERVWMDSAGNALGQIGTGPRVILYNAHLDTNEVDDDAAYWPHPPFEPVIEDGRMWGLGASDCKGGVAAIIYGAAIFKALGLGNRCSLIVMGATLEEDAEGFALRSLVERDGLRPDVVLLAEATGMELRIGQRGRCGVRIRTEGQTVHASTPHLGENAVDKMIPVLQALNAMNAHLPWHPIFGQGSQTVTMITSPRTPNSVPAWCEVMLDRRMVPGETVESVIHGICQVVEPLGALAWVPDQTVLTHTGLRLDGPNFYPGWLLDQQSRLLQAAQSTCQAMWGHEAKVDVWRFSTDGTYSAGTAGIPTLGFGPQEEEYVHTPQDHVRLDWLREAAVFYGVFPTIDQG